MFSFVKKKGPTFGLDINSDSITLMQLDKTRVGVEVHRFARQPTPPNSVREGLIADPGTLGGVVLDLLSQAGIPPSGPSPVVNVAVPAQAVVIRLMPVPTGMPPEELADVVTQEATNHVPFPIEDANLDWSIMPATERTDADGVRRVDVIIAAIQRSIIESYWRMTDSAGVRLGRVDVSSLSVIRSLALVGYLGSSGHLSMIVNIRHDATDINVVRSALPLFGRSIILGVETLLEAISRSLDIHFDQALRMLPSIQLFDSGPLTPELGQATQVVRTVFGDIADELLRSLDFYKSQVGDVKVDQIILSGPGCIVGQLDQFIANKLNLRTLISDPMRDLVFDKDLIEEKMRPVLASLIGSTLEPAWNPSFTVNLDLNKEGRLPLALDETKTQIITREAKAIPWMRPLLYAGIALVAIVITTWAYLTRIDLTNKEREMDSLKTEIDTSRRELSKLSKLRQDNSLLTRKKRILDGIVKKTGRWSDVLDAVRTNVPSGVHIDRIVIQGKKAKVEGTAVDFTNVSHLALNLKTSPVVKESSIEWATRKEKNPKVVTFSVIAQVEQPGYVSLPDATQANVVPTADKAKETMKDDRPIRLDSDKLIKSVD